MRGHIHVGTFVYSCFIFFFDFVRSEAANLSWWNGQNLLMLQLTGPNPALSKESKISISGANFDLLIDWNYLEHYSSHGIYLFSWLHNHDCFGAKRKCTVAGHIYKNLGQTFLTIVKVSGIYCSLAEDILLQWHIERQVIFKILCSIPKIS